MPSLNFGLNKKLFQPADSQNLMTARAASPQRNQASSNLLFAALSKKHQDVFTRVKKAESDYLGGCKALGVDPQYEKPADVPENKTQLKQRLDAFARAFNTNKLHIDTARIQKMDTRQIEQELQQELATIMEID